MIMLLHKTMETKLINDNINHKLHTVTLKKKKQQQANNKKVYHEKVGKG